MGSMMIKLCGLILVFRFFPPFSVVRWRLFRTKLMDYEGSSRTLLYVKNL